MTLTDSNVAKTKEIQRPSSITLLEAGDTSGIFQPSRSGGSCRLAGWPNCRGRFRLSKSIYMRSFDGSFDWRLKCGTEAFGIGRYVGGSECVAFYHGGALMENLVSGALDLDIVSPVGPSAMRSSLSCAR